jgi:hypothetical protein
MIKRKELSGKIKSAPEDNKSIASNYCLACGENFLPDEQWYHAERRCFQHKLNWRRKYHKNTQNTTASDAKNHTTRPDCNIVSGGHLEVKQSSLTVYLSAISAICISLFSVFWLIQQSISTNARPLSAYAHSDDDILSIIPDDRKMKSGASLKNFAQSGVENGPPIADISLEQDFYKRPPVISLEAAPRKQTNPLRVDGLILPSWSMRAGGDGFDHTGYQSNGYKSAPLYGDLVNNSHGGGGIVTKLSSNHYKSVLWTLWYAGEDQVDKVKKTILKCNDGIWPIHEADEIYFDQANDGPDKPVVVEWIDHDRPIFTPGVQYDCKLEIAEKK